MSSRATAETKKETSNSSVPSFSIVPWLSLSKIQSGLTVNRPGDQYEQEADRIAEQITGMSEPQVMRKTEEDEYRQVYVAPDAVEKALSLHGHPLEPGIRALMESRFDHDFRNVRVHTDSKAAESAKSVNAKAFTFGKDVVFGQGQYQSSTEGKRLLAHELTHVIQQSHNQQGLPAIQRDDIPGTSTTVSQLPPDLSLSYTDFLRMQDEQFAPIYRYMEENRTVLRSLSEWVSAIRRNVPESADISRAEIELAVNQGAEQFDITISPIPIVPPTSGGSTEEQSSSERLVNALRGLKDQIEDFVDSLTTYGNPESIEVSLDFSGIETALERSGFRFSWTVGWHGQLGAKVSHRVFNGDLSFSINSDWIAPEENPSFSATIQFGPSEPNYSRVNETFNNAGTTLTNYLRGLIESSSGDIDAQVSEAETSIEDMIDRMSDAIDMVDSMTPDEEDEEEGFPPITFSIQTGYGRPSLLPSEEGRPESPAGFFVQGFLNLHF